MTSVAPLIFFHKTTLAFAEAAAAAGGTAMEAARLLPLMPDTPPPMAISGAIRLLHEMKQH